MQRYATLQALGTTCPRQGFNWMETADHIEFSGGCIAYYVDRRRVSKYRRRRRNQREAGNPSSGVI